MKHDKEMQASAAGSGSPDDGFGWTPAGAGQASALRSASKGVAHGQEEKRLKRPLSKRSGGPQSAAGRARASRNAIKHGAYSLHPTQLDVYHEKLCGVEEELKPKGVIAQTLCQDIAHSLVKLQTLNCHERERIRKAEHDAVNLKELASRVDFPWPQTHLENLGSPQALGRLQSEVLRVWRKLAKPPTVPNQTPPRSRPSAKAKPTFKRQALQHKFPGAGPGPTSETQAQVAPDAKRPGAVGLGEGRAQTGQEGISTALLCEADLRTQRMYWQACELFSSPLNQFEQDHFLQDMDVVMLDARQGLGYFGQRLARLGDISALVAYWLLRNQSKLQEATHQLKNERTIAVLTDEHICRAKAHVQRGLREGLNSLLEVQGLKLAHRA